MSGDTKIANFSGPCPECSLTRIMFLESTWHQKEKQRKEAAFMHHQGFIYEEPHFPPPPKNTLPNVHFTLV